MFKRSFQIITVLFIVGCTSPNTNSTNNTTFEYKNSPLGTMKEIYNRSFNNSDEYDARAYFLRKHKDEVLKTLEIVEEVEVQKDIVLIFYRYSVGADIVKKTTYMRKMDGLYIPYSKYYSSYDDDPFKNGKGEEAKALLKKATDWEENDNIWWAY